MSDKIKKYHMKNRLLYFFIASFTCVGWASPANVTISHLLVEMKQNPVGVEVMNPRFSWQISSDTPDLLQKEYQIQVAETKSNLTEGKDLIWDSGIVKSDNSLLVPFAGKTLKSRSQYYWRVRVKTNQGFSDWSNISEWSMTLLYPSDWNAEWIGENIMSNPGETDHAKTRLAARYLRKEFNTTNPVKRAMLYISGLGSYEAYINGKRVSNDLMAPDPSLYTDRVYYNVYDVTGMLQDDNTLGVILGNGRFFGMRGINIKGFPDFASFGLPRLLAQLEIEYEDGTVSRIATDKTWKVTSKGPIVTNNEFDGEEYDARLCLGKWNTNGFDDSNWKFADIMEAPKGKLTSQQNPNICVQEELHPLSITMFSNGRCIVDMGQNMVGYLNVTLKGMKDDTVTMRFAETLNKDSSLYVENLRSASATDKYIPDQDGEFTWEPKFIYHGFRYVEISGIHSAPAVSSITGKVIYDRMETTGHFETSNELVNTIYKNAYWGIRSNYRGMPTDCPQRDERQGWLGDRATGCYGESFVFDNALLYNKWVQDIEDSQSSEGSISDVSPKYWTLYNDDVTWPSAFFYAADMIYRQYGDDSAIRNHYQAMKKWMKHVQEVSMKDYIMTKDSYGDWCMPPESQSLIHSKDPSRKTDGRILNTAVYYDLLNKMIQFASICGNNDDIPVYRQLASKVRESYNSKFFDSKKAQYGNNTVTANLLSLRLGLVPEGCRNKVFANIVEKTEKDFDGHVSVGVLGIQHIMRGLTENGRQDMAWKMLTAETYPGWGYMVKNGATTIWELWNGNTADPAMNSGNHVMLLGDLNIWFYENLAGIRCAPGTQGYRKLLMCPVYPDGLNSVKASYNSVSGLIKSEWKRTGKNFEWNVSIPGNVSAIVRIPKEFNVSKIKQAGIRKVTQSGQYDEFEIGSGNYRFVSE